MSSEFEIKLVIAQLKALVKSKPNHADFEFHKELIKELETKLYGTCGICDENCGNDWCITKGDKDVKDK